MQHIDNVTIHAFRGLKELELNDFSRINLFVGDNNCGKTSVLEALYAFCNPADAFKLIQISRLREARFISGRGALNTLQRVKWLFPATTQNTSSHTAELAISGSGRIRIRKYSAVFEEVQGIPEESSIGIESQAALEGFESLLTHEEEDGLTITLKTERADTLPGIFDSDNITIWNNTPTQYIRKSIQFEAKLPVKFVEPHAHRIFGVYAKLYSQAYSLGLLDNLTELLQEFDPDIQGLVILEEEGAATLHIEHRKTGTAPIISFGDGLRRVLFIAMQLISAKDGVCILDELDNSIHTSALQETATWIAKAAEKLDIQVFASTHSLEAVDAFIDASIDDLAVYKLNQGGSLFKRYSHDILYRIRHKRGFDVR
ncbi:AAA family ATPase [Maridesulfovibrio frigidus]|uniref:AAA family ATPase n=1 Tax=Maridesulfovibrio frigidus TaxID=340956 RepID=UPI00068DC84D|nr:AAA family ATPase [Maridesulfovibrio frigidus]